MMRILRGLLLLICSSCSFGYSFEKVNNFISNNTIGNNQMEKLLQRNEFSKNVSIVVNSCDKRSWMWKSFFHFLFKHIPQLNTEYKDLEIYLLSNKEIFPDERVKTFCVFPEITQCDNLVQCLNFIKKDYIIYIQDDFILNQDVDLERISSILEYMKKTNSPCTQLIHSPIAGSRKNVINIKNDLNLKLKKGNAPFKAALQVGLWEKDTFLYYANNANTVWDFEKKGTKLAFKDKRPYYIVDKNNPAIHYKRKAGLTVKGKILPDVVMQIFRNFPNFNKNCKKKLFSNDKVNEKLAIQIFKNFPYPYHSYPDFEIFFENL